MEDTLEQRLATVEKSLSELTTPVLKLTPVKKDRRKSVGKLRDTPLAREVDRLGREYRAAQNQNQSLEAVLVLDTDHLTALGYDTPLSHRLLARLSASGQEVTTSAVNVDEQLTGLLAAVHQHKDPANQMLPYAELVERMEFLAGFIILPWDAESISFFRSMKTQKIATGTMDLKIGCVALAHDATVLTRNTLDFCRIPGLNVENWLD